MAESNSSSSHTLQADALGLLGTVSLTAAYMAPAAAVIALFAPVFAIAGAKSAFVMLVGLIVTLPSGISFGMLAKELPAAGGVASWARTTLGLHMGRWVGITTAMFYIATIVFPPIVFGQLFNNVLYDFFGINGNMTTWFVGAMLSLAIAGFVTYRGIAVSSYLAFAMLVIQLVVMTALSGTFVAAAIQDGTFTLDVFTPPDWSSGGWAIIFAALPFAMLSFICDAATPVAEETKDARRTIPLAIIMTLIVVGIWDVLAFGAFAMAAPADQLREIMAKDVNNAIPVLAETVWGPFKTLATIVGMLAMIGGLVPCCTAASRVLYSLGRDGTLPKWFGATHRKHRTPWNSLHVVFLTTILAFAPMTLLFHASNRIEWGPIDTMGWWGNVIAWFILAVYFTTNVCNIVFYWRFRRDRFNVFLNFLVPLFAMVVQSYVVWELIIKGLWGMGWPGQSVQIFIVIVTLLVAIYVYCIRDRVAESAT